MSIELGGEFDYSSNPYADLENEPEFDSKVGAYDLLELPDTAPSKYENSELLDPNIDYNHALAVQVAENNLNAARGQEAEVMAEFAHYQDAALQDAGFTKYLESVEYGANSHIQINPQVASFVEQKFGHDVDDLQNLVAYYKMTPTEIASLERKILGNSPRATQARTVQPNYQDEVVESDRDHTDSVDVGDMNLLVENLKHQHGLTEEGVKAMLSQADEYLNNNSHLNDQFDTREKVMQFLGQFVPPKKSTPKSNPRVTPQANQTRTTDTSKKQGVRGTSGGKAKPDLGGKSIPWSNITKLSEQEYAANIDRIERLYSSGLIDYSK
jgi:hypothetical protein